MLKFHNCLIFALLVTASKISKALQFSLHKVYINKKKVFWQMFHIHNLAEKAICEVI